MIRIGTIYTLARSRTDASYSMMRCGREDLPSRHRRFRNSSPHWWTRWRHETSDRASAPSLMARAAGSALGSDEQVGFGTGGEGDADTAGGLDDARHPSAGGAAARRTRRWRVRGASMALRTLSISLPSEGTAQAPSSLGSGSPPEHIKPIVPSSERPSIVAARLVANAALMSLDSRDVGTAWIDAIPIYWSSAAQTGPFLAPEIRRECLRTA